MEQQEDQYAELFAVPNAQVGQVLRIRLPQDFTVTERTPLAISRSPAPVSRLSRMANNLLALAQITRDAVRLFRNSNAFLQRQPLQPWPEQTPEEWQRARERSFELLRSWLDPQQLASFQEHQFFEVTGGETGVRYRLRPQSAFGIEALTGRRKGTLYCVVPTGAPALGDILLAQKIGLETAERATLARANKNYEDTYL